MGQAILRSCTYTKKKNFKHVSLDMKLAPDIREGEHISEVFVVGVVESNIVAAGIAPPSCGLTSHHLWRAACPLTAYSLPSNNSSPRNKGLLDFFRTLYPMPDLLFTIRIDTQPPRIPSGTTSARIPGRHQYSKNGALHRQVRVSCRWPPHSHL
jgi:hypothetical protein